MSPRLRVRSIIIAAAAGALVACTVEPSKKVDRGPDAPGRIGTEFIADVNPAAGTFEIKPLYGTTGRGGFPMLEPANVVQNGIPLDGPLNSVELVTLGTFTDPDGTGTCGFASSFCADVLITNFYNGPLFEVFVEINAISPVANHTGLNSDPLPGYPNPLDDTLGLWFYDVIDAGLFAQRRWVFGDDGTPYRVRGTVWADLPFIPMGFGYTGGTTTFSFEDISGTGSALSLGDDQLSAPLGIGWAFDFFGAPRDVRVSSNGFLVLNPAEIDDGCCSGQLIPDPSQPNGIISGYWSDLAPNEGGAIHVQTLGVPPFRRFIAQWTDVPHCCGPGTPTATFQIVLFEDGSHAQIRHLLSTSDGTDHSLGIEDDSGTDGLNLAFGDLSFGNIAFEIVHP